MTCRRVASLVALTLAAGCGAAPARSTKAPPLAAGTAETTTYRYCAGTVTEFEVHRCIFELTEAQQRRRGYSQRLVYDKGKLVRFEELNGFGTLLDDDHYRTAFSTYFYDGDRVIGWVNGSRNGVVRRSMRVVDNGAWVQWLDEQGRPNVRSGTRASGLKRTLDERGRVTAYTYVDAQGNPTPSVDGRVEVRTRRNAAGALYEQSYFDAQGRPMRDKYGVHREASTLDAMGSAVKKTYFGEKAEPVVDSYGLHRVDTVFDDVGNVIGEWYFGLQGERVRSTGNGAAGYRMARDEHGSEISLTYLDERGAPTLSKYGYVTRKIVVDKAGDEIEWSFYGLNDVPIQLRPDQHSIKRATRDARGNVVLESFLDTEGRPMLFEADYHAIRMEYDDRDNLVRGTYLDENLQPKANKAFYAAWSSEYDGDRPTWTRFLSAEGEPMDVGWGYAAKLRNYDAMGVEGTVEYTDARNRPVQKPDQCEDYGADQAAALRAALEPTLWCGLSGGPPGAVLVLQAGGNGQIQSAAFVALTQRAVRECLERALSAVTLPASEHACTRLMTAVRFAERQIKILPAGAGQTSSASTGKN